MWNECGYSIVPVIVDKFKGWIIAMSVGHDGGTVAVAVATDTTYEAIHYNNNVRRPNVCECSTCAAEYRAVGKVRRRLTIEDDNDDDNDDDDTNYDDDTDNDNAEDDGDGDDDGVADEHWNVRSMSLK